MIKSLSLQNFRNYTKRSFEFNEGSTLIVGPNAIGKTNILEAIYLLATGKSFRAEEEQEIIKEGEGFAKVVGETDGTELEIDYIRPGLASSQDLVLHSSRFTKLYKVNGVGKRQIDFVGNLRAVLFSPQDIEIATDSPSTRRKYLDMVLIQTHKDYRAAASIYERALRQRNRLLWRIREENLDREQLHYWSSLLIANGQIIHERRKEFIEFLNALPNKIFPIHLKYDHSIISADRLAKYANEEIASATTLVGPHRDNFIIEKHHLKHEESIRSYGSRGEQRLAVFAIKLGELEYVKKITGEAPILLLDDIFSELDHENRHHILDAIPKQQTIMTTTDLHLVDKKAIKDAGIVVLGQK